jgi:hypothetical protein
MSLKPCSQALESHPGLAQRRALSAVQLGRILGAFERSTFLASVPISVFCAGSLARREVGTKSDLDVFVTADEDLTLHSKLCEYTLFAELIGLNNSLGLPQFSNDGKYLKIYFLNDLKRLTGSPADDAENLFTARMLLMLESEPLVNPGMHARHLQAIIEHYYRDSYGKRSFRPLFLLNDLLRYWRTLCLNYEERRHDPSKPWRKKNVNLKFSRVVTVFSMILPLVMRSTTAEEEIFDLCRQEPLVRLARALDILDDPRLTAEWPQVLNLYEEFLGWKEDENVEQYLESEEHKVAVKSRAERLSKFLYAALMHDRIPLEFRRYLVL